MYEFFKGNLVSIHPTYVVVEVRGIGYKIYCANPYRFQSQLATEIQIEIEQIVREDAMTLYGFRTADEKQLFMKLISVSGIGPKSAISILSNDDLQGFVQAIESANITYLTKFPGVGKKTAQQIVLDLKGKFEGISKEGEVAPLFPSDEQESKLMEDAREALLGLGYSSKEISRIWKELEKEAFDTTESVLRKAFTLLLK